MSKWKQANWDKWTFGKKVRHVIAVALSLITSLAMLVIFLWLVLFLFGVQGFLLKLRDAILLDFMHWLVLL